MAKRKTVSSDNETNYGSDPEQHDYKNYARMKDAVSLFAFTLDNVSESACITDSEGNIVFLNQAGKLLLGISASQVNESNIFHKLGGVNRDEFFSAFVDRDQQKWEGDLSVFNKREIPVHVRSSRFQAPDGMVYISTIMTEKQDLDEKLSIRSYCDFAESLPSVGLGIWHLEGSISPNIIPIFRLIQLNRSARERLSPIEIEIGRTINESLREPHNRDTALFFASVLLTGTPSYIDQFTLDGKAQFSIRAFPLKHNCIAIYFDVAMKETVPHEVFYELFDYYPLLTALFQKDPEGPDYTWRISCAMSRNIRKEGWRPPVGTKLSQMAQRMTSDPKLLAAVNIAKPGQSVRIVVNDWTNNQYKGHIFEGQILKLNRDYIALVFKPLNAETLQLETNLLNFASQRTTKLDERLADTFFFNESLVPIYNNEDSPPLDQLPYPSIANIAPSHQPPIPVYAPPVEPTLTKKFNYSISDMSRPQFAAQQQCFVPQSKHSRPYPEAPPVPEKPDHLSSLLHHISGSELSAEYFKRGFYESSIGMTMVSPQGNFLAINNALCRALGYSTDEFLQHSFLPMTHPEDIDKSVGLLRQMLNGEIHTFHMLKRYLHKYGHVIWCLLSTSLVRDHNGNPIFFITQIIPVESVRNMLNGSEVKRDEELYHQLFSSCPQGSCILTRDGGISSVNRMMCSLTEYEAFEIIGKPILNVVCKEDADNIRNTIGRLCMETKSSSAFAYLRIDAKNSGPKWIYAQLVNLPDSNGYTTHVGLFVQEFLSLQRIANMEQHQPVNSKWDKYH